MTGTGKDTAVTAYIVAASSMTLTDINEILVLVSLVVAIALGLLRIRRSFKFRNVPPTRKE